MSTTRAKPPSTFGKGLNSGAGSRALPERSIQLTQVSEWRDGEIFSHGDALAVEEPLEIRIGDLPISVTMRTPGHDRELAAGFLWSEGIVEDAAQITALHIRVTSAAGKENAVEAQLTGCEWTPAELKRNFFATSSCGICGKASIEAVRLRGLRAPTVEFILDPSVLCSLADKLADAQTVFHRTGGLHAAALFDSEGNLLVLREDIGRHNAVDKIIGWAMLSGNLPLSSCVMMVSGRGGFEIVQKSLSAGLPVLACVSAPSSLAVQLARELGLTLIGFLRGNRFVVYSGAHRLAGDHGNTN